MDYTGKYNQINDGFSSQETSYSPSEIKISSNDKNEPLREQDRFLPIANIARIMKKSIPPSGKIAKDAKECIQECVSEFLSFITSEASDKCQLERRKTINGDDIIYAMGVLGFDPYIEPLKLYLSKYRDSMKAAEKSMQSTKLNFQNLASELLNKSSNSPGLDQNMMTLNALNTYTSNLIGSKDLGLFRDRINISPTQPNVFIMPYKSNRSNIVEDNVTCESKDNLILTKLLNSYKGDDNDSDNFDILTDNHAMGGDNNNYSHQQLKMAELGTQILMEHIQSTEIEIQGGVTSNDSANPRSEGENLNDSNQLLIHSRATSNQISNMEVERELEFNEGHFTNVNQDLFSNNNNDNNFSNGSFRIIHEQSLPSILQVISSSSHPQLSQLDLSQSAHDTLH
ncbi:unnamed protein product [Gordionus sp. m RMFG-2023]|uniref:uncharacterized protein LOC135923750 n=1 Tax=Gordionus sp. m RMFG-2023 TaxID=3053472 RepID=UPI0030E49B38